MTYYWKDRERALAYVRAGATAAAAAALISAPAPTVQRWCAAEGIRLGRGRPRRGYELPEPPKAEERGPRPSPRSRLAVEDRAAIQEGLRAGRSMREIAADLGFAHTTVSREVRRASDPATGRYSCSAAQARASRMRRRPRAAKLDSDPALRAYVVAGLDGAWSPRQIAGRIRVDFPDDPSMRVSHEAIYRALYVQGKGALRHELACEQALRSGRKARRPRSKLPPRRGRRRWVEGCEISKRPPEASDRSVPGSWEGDLVVGGAGRSCLVTLVERKTRYLEMRALPRHDSRTVVDLLKGMAASLPEGVRRAALTTLTWDQGAEMALCSELVEAAGVRVYFCDPHSPWQKGTNENTNGLIRQFFPKGTEFDEVTEEEVRRVQDLINGRPRETLGWRTPAEAMAEVLAGAISDRSGAMIA